MTRERYPTTAVHGHPGDEQRDTSSSVGTHHVRCRKAGAAGDRPVRLCVSNIKPSSAHKDRVRRSRRGESAGQAFRRLVRQSEAPQRPIFARIGTPAAPRPGASVATVDARALRWTPLYLCGPARHRSERRPGRFEDSGNRAPELDQPRYPAAPANRNRRPNRVSARSGRARGVCSCAMVCVVPPYLSREEAYFGAGGIGGLLGVSWLGGYTRHPDPSLNDMSVAPVGGVPGRRSIPGCPRSEPSARRSRPRHPPGASPLRPPRPASAALPAGSR
jgi:hypothetical protein